MDPKSEFIDLGYYKEEGVYLIFRDSSRLDITKASVEKKAKEYWEDPSRISPKVKEAIEFQRCPFCPLKGKRDLCDALRPVLPYMEVMDKFASYDKVTAIYRNENDDVCQVSNTTMQRALRFIATISLMRYCLAGRKFWKYFLGINPIMRAREVTRTLYTNIFYLNKGDRDAVAAAIKEFSETVTATGSNQVRRMNLIAKSDVFANAFVETCVPTMFLSSHIEEMTAEEFAVFDKKMSR